MLDIQQPDAGGLAVPRELKARLIGLPVIDLVDAGGDATFGVHVMKAGAVDFPPLPYRTANLIATRPGPEPGSTSAFVSGRSGLHRDDGGSRRPG
ncbi:hypothetical protein [Azospirillum formosense]|uniref:hypothetical protein n=1 Tax=Azospirillum formosense TaxID=861533 RepID=UPI001C8FF7CC|nr:hypothetical protein [Azospirillum formosense]